MLTRQKLDRIVQRITGQDIRLADFGAPLPGLVEFRAEYAEELGVCEEALLRCGDLMDVVDLAVTRRSVRQREAEQRRLF